MNIRRLTYSLLAMSLLLISLMPALTWSAAKANSSPSVNLDLSSANDAKISSEATDSVIFVKADATGANNGTSWTDAYTDLQEALAAATDGDEIWVAAGTYKPTDNGDRTISFRLKNGVAIYGGFNGTETTRDERNWGANPTILSGDIGIEDDKSDNSYHVVSASSVDKTTILDGFTITKGYANGNDSSSDEAGGMRNQASSPTLNNLLITKNEASRGAGMVNLSDSHPILSNVTFSHNVANGHGGGMLNQSNSNPTLIDVAFYHNVAPSGGGIYNRNSAPTITSTKFVYNQAEFGGGLYNRDNSRPLLNNVEFKGNSASSTGGGMRNYNNNHPTLNNVIFTGNFAGRYGGAISNEKDSHSSLTNVTIAGNSAGKSSGGISNTDNSMITISNSIVFNNHAPNHRPQIGNNDDNSTVSISYSIVQGGWAGTNNINADPLFVESINPDDAPTIAGDFHLSPISPAIDAGDNSTVPADTVDLDGNPRFQDHPAADTGNGTAPIVDMGAYETGSIIYVKANATGTNDGSSWADAYTDLQNGLAATTDGDEIWVAAGTYKPTDDGNRETSFWLKNGVRLYGGFDGTETAHSQRDWEANQTILSGDLDGNDNDNILHDESTRAENSYHVVQAYSVDDTAKLDGFTITGGNANVAGGSTDDGGGMRNIVSSPTLSNLVFMNNTALSAGGMNAYLSSPTLINVTFSNNVAEYAGGMLNYGHRTTIYNVIFINNRATRFHGGGIYNNRSTPFFNKVIFTGNSAADRGGGMYNNQSHSIITDATFTSNSASVGGGMRNYRSNPTVRNATFTSNSAFDNGGGMYNSLSNPQLYDVKFIGNQANGERGSVFGHGGGMFSTESRPTLVNVLFQNNSANGVGGGMANHTNCEAFLTNVTFSNNSAMDDGGGLFNYDTHAILNNVTFIGNSADGIVDEAGGDSSDDGGGMQNSESSAILNNVHFTGNYAKNFGGGMGNYQSTVLMNNVTLSVNFAKEAGGISSYDSQLTISNSILWNNKDEKNGTGATSQFSSFNNSTATVTYSLVQGGWEGEGNINADPLFVSPISPDDAPTTSGDFRLQLGSPAIDAGSNALLPTDTLDLDEDGDTSEPLPYDLDGHARIFNDTVDMGAYERLSDLSLSKTVSPHSQEAKRGDTLTYQIELTATYGTAEVVLSDTLPTGMSYVQDSLTGGAVYDIDTNQIDYTGRVSPDTPLVIQYQVKVNSDVAFGSILNNSVVVTGRDILLEDAVAVAIPERRFKESLLLLYVNGDNDLSEDMLDLINRAEQAAGNEHVKILLLLDGPNDGDTYLYRLEEDFDGSCPNYSEIDLGCNGRYVLGQNLWEWRENIASPYSLSEFLIGAQRAYPNAEQTILSLVGHGGGWAATVPGGQPGGGGHGVKPGGPGGLLWDDHFGSSLSTAELGQALSWFHEATGEKIDLLYLDACLMATAEVAYEVRDSVDYLLASQSWSWTAFPYDAHISAIDGDKDARQIGEAWLANEASDLRRDDYPFTFSLIDLSQMEELRKQLDTLMSELSGRLPDDQDKIDAAFAKSACFDSNSDGYIVQPGDNSDLPLDNYCDLGSFARQIEIQFAGNNRIVNAAKAVQDTIATAVVAEDHNNGIPWGYSEQEWSWGDQLSGMTSYLPLVEDEWRRRYYNPDHLSFAKDSQMDDFFVTYWKSATPPDEPLCGGDEDCSPSGPLDIAPISLQVSAGQDSINVGWTLQEALSGELQDYKLYRSPNGGTYLPITTGSDTQYTDDNQEELIQRQEYCYYVQALDQNNHVIGLSNVACAKFGELTLWLPDQVVEPNATDVLVPINLKNGTGLCIENMDIAIFYEPAIARATGTVSATGYSEGYHFSADTKTPGHVKIAAITEQCQELYDGGSLFMVGFDISDNEGEVSTLDFIKSITAIFDNESSKPLDLELQAGSLKVGNVFVRGDINGDGQVSSRDAFLGLSVANDESTPSLEQRMACDVNGDGKCNSADSTTILCYAASRDWNKCANSQSRSAQSRHMQNQPVEVAIGQMTQRGLTVTVPITLKNAPDFTAGEFTLAYDADKMLAHDASLTSLTEAFISASNIQQPGLLQVSLAGMEPIGADGAILELEFTLADESEISSIQFGSVRLYDEIGRDFETSALQREIELVPYEEQFNR